MTFSEGFVADVSRFVEAMDRASDLGFLNGPDWGDLGSDWAELGWLKAQGYYSMEAFVANRVEVALRLAWLNCNNGKKRGVKLKEKAKASNAAGVGTNVYWRKRGCVEWWDRLDGEVKGKAFRMVLAQAGKSLTGEILKGAAGFLEGGFSNFDIGVEQPLRPSYHGSSTGELLQRDAESSLTMNLASSSSKPPTSLVCAINRLFVLQVIIAMELASHHDEFDKEKLFFSSLDSVNTVSDSILRKLRGLLMVVSLDSTKVELLEEENKKFMPNKPKEKLPATNRKKKGKNRNAKRSNPVLKNCEDGFLPDKTIGDGESGLMHNKNLDLDLLKKKNDALEGASGPSLLSSAKKENKEEKFQNSPPERLQAPATKNRKQNRKKKSRGKCDASSEVHNTSSGIQTVSSSGVAAQCGGRWSESSASFTKKESKDSSISGQNIEQNFDPCNCKVGPTMEDTPSDEPGNVVSSKKLRNDVAVSEAGNVNHTADSERGSVVLTTEQPQSVHKECCKDPVLSQTVVRSGLCGKSADANNVTVPIYEQDNESRYDSQAVVSAGYPSYEWPAVAPFRLASFNSHYLPPATDRLHLEVGHNWQNHVQPSFIQQMHKANSSMVRTCNYDSAFISRRQAAMQSSHFSTVSNEEDRKYSADCFDLCEPTTTQDIADEYDGHWVSEEEYEVHTVSGIDYNQFFGGGVMYWNPSDYRGAGFSRPPSLSSDDSSWAWREADMNRTVDDMVAFSSSYSTNGLTSPSAAPFCSPFESLTPGHQAIGYVRSGSEMSGKVLHNSSTLTDLEAEEKVPGPLASIPSDSDAYPVLRPIIIPNMSRERSRSEFKGNHDLRSPRVPPTRREQPRIKRPPSPVVLCVPRAPRPPPPSPVGDSKKHRGFPTVRSGSSSPRHWGMRGWFHDGSNLEETCVRVDGAEVVWPSWGNKNFSPRQMVQPLPGAILQDRLIAIPQMTHDQEHPDVALPLQPPELLNCPTRKASLPLIHNLLHDEIDSFCKQVAAENLIRRPYISWAVKRVTRSLQVLWPRSRTNIFGSNATGLSLPTSDVDLVVCLPPVRNLEPIKEAGILEGRNSIKETCLQHAARYLGNQEWVKADSLKTVENTAIPIIMLVVDVPHDLVTAATSNVHTSLHEQNLLNNGQGINQSDPVGSDTSPSTECSELINCGKEAVSVRLDISFKSPSHTGLQTTELVKQLTDQFPAASPLALVLKQFLADRSLDQSYSGGLSSYCLVLLIIRFLQHEHHHGRCINQNLGSLFMDFLYFFGNVFDPRQMRISIQGSGLYINRERGYSIDPIYIDDPLFPTNNVGKNCFRIHQCIKAFADAYSTLENELDFLTTDGDMDTMPQYRLLRKINPCISLP